MKLSCAEKGKNYKICALRLMPKTKRHMLALGMTAGANLAVLGKSLSGGMIIRVRNARLALGKCFCEGIFVKEETE